MGFAGGRARLKDKGLGGYKGVSSGQFTFATSAVSETALGPTAQQQLEDYIDQQCAEMGEGFRESLNFMLQDVRTVGAEQMFLDLVAEGEPLRAWGLTAQRAETATTLTCLGYNDVQMFEGQTLKAYETSYLRVPPERYEAINEYCALVGEGYEQRQVQRLCSLRNEQFSSWESADWKDGEQADAELRELIRPGYKNELAKLGSLGAEADLKTMLTDTQITGAEIVGYIEAMSSKAPRYEIEQLYRRGISPEIYAEFGDRLSKRYSKEELESGQIPAKRLRSLAYHLGTLDYDDLVDIDEKVGPGVSGAKLKELFPLADNPEKWAAPTYGTQLKSLLDTGVPASQITEMSNKLSSVRSYSKSLGTAKAIARGLDTEQKVAAYLGDIRSGYVSRETRSLDYLTIVNRGLDKGYTASDLAAFVASGADLGKLGSIPNDVDFWAIAAEDRKKFEAEHQRPWPVSKDEYLKRNALRNQREDLLS